MIETNSYIFEKLSVFHDVPFAWFFADAPIFFLPIFLAGLWLFYTFWKTKSDKRIELLHIFYVCIIGMVLSFVIKHLFDIDRPESYLDQTKNLILSHIPEKSFPSDHATISFAFLASLFYTWFSRIWYAFLPFVLFMNAFRIIVWVHWPADIFVGGIVWIVSCLIFFHYISKFKLVKNIDLFIIKCMKYIKLY